MFMKHLEISRKSLKYLLAIGLLTACSHDESINPTQNYSTEVNSKNAKISSLTRLVKDGEKTIQYVKAGKFFGKISRINEENSYLEYTYDDKNAAGDLWIHLKRYSDTYNQVISHRVYQVSNGRCVYSHDYDDARSYQLKYNILGLLDEVKVTAPGWAGPETHKFTYDLNSATQTYRLTTKTVTTASGPSGEVKFTYSSKKDMHFKNPYGVTVNWALDPYLPIYGTFSDALVEGVEYTSLNTTTKYYSEFDYALDGDGLVISMTKKYHPFGKGNNNSVTNSTITFSYSTAWQGI